MAACNPDGGADPPATAVVDRGDVEPAEPEPQTEVEKPSEAPDPTEAEILDLMVSCFTAQNSNEQKDINPERFKIVHRECPTCEKSEVAGLSESHDVMKNGLEYSMACCDAEHIDKEGRARKAVTPTLRRKLFERENYRCATPGCEHWLHLEVHHVIPQVHNGPHTETNCLVLCTMCHTRTHEGLLHIEPGGSGSFSFVWAMQPQGAHPKHSSTAAPHAGR